MATLALPSGVLAPVECSHGRHVQIFSACLALASSVHLGISCPPVNSLVRGFFDLFTFGGFFVFSRAGGVFLESMGCIKKP